MNYRCIKKIKGFIFAKYRVDEIISISEYNDLSQPEKLCFVEDNSDESIADQFEENQEADDRAEKN